MAVTSSKVDRTISVSVDSQNIGTYTLRYIIETNSSMGPASVAAGAQLSSPHALPTLWQSWSYLGDTDALSYAQEYQFERDPGSLYLWYCTVKYMPVNPGGNAGSDGNSSTTGDPILAEPVPTNRPPVYWWDRETYTQKVEHTVSGHGIVNSALAPYEDAHEEEYTRGVLVAEINVSTLAEVIELSSGYERAVNKTAWNIAGTSFPARTVCCREVSSGPPINEQGYTYYRVVFRFAFSDWDKSASKWDTWDATYIEKGSTYWEKDASGNYKTEFGSVFRKRFATPNGEPVYLKADGTRLEEDQQPVKVRFRVKREVDFNNLPL